MISFVECQHPILLFKDNVTVIIITSIEHHITADYIQLDCGLNTELKG